MSKILNAINYFWKMGFNEEEVDVYVKNYRGFTRISIDVANEVIDYGDEIRMSEEKRVQFSQKNFILLEAVDRFLKKNYLPENLHIGRSEMYDFAVEDGSGQVLIAVRCMEWEEEYDEEVAELRTASTMMRSFFEKNDNTEYFCLYTSRLKAGAIECRYTVFPKTVCTDDTRIYNRGLFDEGIQASSPEFKDHLYEGQTSSENTEIVGDFEISDGELVKYTGTERHVIIPEGVEKLRNGVFWNCSSIEEITVPESVYSLGGDTFYDCENLSEFVIPESVVIVGDNPFANCPKLNLFNKSPHFVFENGSLYDVEKTRLIYYAINCNSDVFEVPHGVISISKHSFYNCHNLRSITIPSTVGIMENNPFSNLPDMRLENSSPNFIFRDGALYNKTMSTLFYYEHSTEPRSLVIPEGVSIIGRHSFYNCKTIETITIPSSVKIIGYNPFTGCSSLTLTNNSPEYVLDHGALYNKEKTELVFYSIPNPAEKFVIPDSVRKIGRSAFFGCVNLRQVVIPEGVRSIERSAFANCSNLKEISIPGSLESVGEWAFMNCTQLESASVLQELNLAQNTEM